MRRLRGARACGCFLAMLVAACNGSAQEARTTLFKVVNAETKDAIGDAILLPDINRSSDESASLAHVDLDSLQRVDIDVTPQKNPGAVRLSSGGFVEVWHDDAASVTTRVRIPLDELGRATTHLVAGTYRVLAWHPSLGDALQRYYDPRTPGPCKIVIQ